MPILISNRGLGGGLKVSGNSTGGFKARYVTPATLLLDTYPGATAAYSLRKLRTAYEGSAIRVRRSSDNTETDIGFVANVLDTTALTTFCGAGNGFVSIWYDQTISGLNLTQTTTTLQPQIVNSGTILTLSAKPAMEFNGLTNSRILQNTSISILQPNTTVLVTRTISNNLNVNVFDGLTTRQAIYGNPSGIISFFAGSTQSSSTVWGLNVTRLVSAIFNGSSSALYSNNSLILSSNPGSNGLNGITLGGYPSGGSYWGGLIPEIIFWNGNQTSNISAINSNINSYYSIY